MSTTHPIAPALTAQLGLHGKQFLLLGVTGEIGPQIAIALAGFGARVHGTTIEQMRDQLPAIEKQFDGLPGSFGSMHTVNVLDRAGIKPFVSALGDSLGGKPLDGVVVVVGGNTKTIAKDGTYADYPDDSMDFMMELNFGGPERYLRAVAPLLKGAEHPRIGLIQTVSDMGLQDKSIGYACAKHAFECLVGSLAVSLSDPRFNPNFRAFGVRPGFLDSVQNRKNLDPTTNPGKLDAILQHIPTHRLQSSRDVGQAIAFLCTPFASIMLNGTIPLHEGFGLMGLGDWTGRMDRMPHGDGG